MKFLVPNYNCLQNPWLGGYRPQIPVLCPLTSTEFVEPPTNKIPGYATAIEPPSKNQFARKSYENQVHNNKNETYCKYRPHANLQTDRLSRRHHTPTHQTDVAVHTDRN